MRKWRTTRKRPRNSRALTVAALAAIGVASLLLLYLRLNGRCEAIGREIQRLEAERAELRRQATAEEYKWANRNSLREIRLALARWGIEMGWPDERRVIWLSRTLEAAEIAPDVPQLVLQPSRAGAGEGRIP